MYAPICIPQLSIKTSKDFYVHSFCVVYRNWHCRRHLYDFKKSFSYNHLEWKSFIRLEFICTCRKRIIWGFYQILNEYFFLILLFTRMQYIKELVITSYCIQLLQFQTSIVNIVFFIFYPIYMDYYFFRILLFRPMRYITELTITCECKQLPHF